MPALSRRSFLAACAALGAGAVAKASLGAPTHLLEKIDRENLKITDVKVTLLSFKLPPEKMWKTATFVVWKTDAILVEVFTDKGLIGIGEPSPYGGPEAVKQFIEEQVRPRLIGKNPFDVESLTASSRDSAFRYQAAWAGVDAALWDIIGKSKGTPVYGLLATDNPPNPHIRMYASGGVEYAWYQRPEDLIDEAARHKDNGYSAFKFRIGTEWKNSQMTIRKYIPWLEKLRQAVGSDFDLIQEVNMRWTLEQCLEVCPVLEDLKFLWLEEPINRRGQSAIEGYIKINQALPRVKVSGGETMMSRLDFKPWIDRDAYDIVQPDVNTTGLTEAWHIARLAHAQNKLCCPHNWHGGLTTMANAALAAAIPNRLMLELNQTFNPFKEEVFKDPLVVKRGYLDLPDKPGFGVELADGLARRFPYLPGSYNRPNPDLPI
jgi:L-alanine-DL-glutamate epimerase-like enolase superfamily enzyme